MIWRTKHYDNYVDYCIYAISCVKFIQTQITYLLIIWIIEIFFSHIFFTWNYKNHAIKSIVIISRDGYSTKSDNDSGGQNIKSFTLSYLIFVACGSFADDYFKNSSYFSRNRNEDITLPRSQTLSAPFTGLRALSGEETPECPMCMPKLPRTCKRGYSINREICYVRSR